MEATHIQAGGGVEGGPGGRCSGSAGGFGGAMCGVGEQGQAGDEDRGEECGDCGPQLEIRGARSAKSETRARNLRLYSLDSASKVVKPSSAGKKLAREDILCLLKPGIYQSPAVVAEAPVDTAGLVQDAV